MFKKDAVNVRIKPFCNLQGEKFEYPSLSFLYQFRIIVTTIMTAANLVRARETDNNFDSRHFSRVFIDEAGCIHEPAVMVPIAGLYLFSFI